MNFIWFSSFALQASYSVLRFSQCYTHRSNRLFAFRSLLINGCELITYSECDAICDVRQNKHIVSVAFGDYVCTFSIFIYSIWFWHGDCLPLGWIHAPWPIRILSNGNENGPRTAGTDQVHLTLWPSSAFYGFNSSFKVFYDRFRDRSSGIQ